MRELTLRPFPQSFLFGTLILSVVVLFSLATGCRPKPKLNITSPTHGTFTTASTVIISGNIENIQVANAIVEVNGSAVTIQPDKTWATSAQALSTVDVFNPFLVELKRANGSSVVRKRVVVIAGDSVADGDFSLDSVALRLNDSGLDQVEPVITSEVNLDLAQLLPPGTKIIDNFCYLDSFLGCVGRADATISSSPPPSIGSYAIDVDSATNFVNGDIFLNDVFVRANVDDASGVPFSCQLTITASTTSIFGDFGLQEGFPDPSNIDVNQLADVVVSFGNFNDSTDCGGIFGGIIEFFIDLFVDNVEDLVRDAMVEFLRDPDGAGSADAPIAEAFETALADISITGPIGEGLGVSLEAPLFGVFEDVDGITLGSDVRMTVDVGTGPGQCIPPAGAPDFSASYHVDQVFPTFGPLTPGGSPYGMGLCVSASAFNQLMKAEVECGLLQTELTELDFGTGPVPITAALLGTFIPEFAPLGSTPLKIVIQPTLAPVVTGNPGPGGELTELRIGQLLVEIHSVSGIPITYLGGAADAIAGLDFAFVAGELVPTLGTPSPSDITVSILTNTINTNATAVEQLLPLVLAPLLPTLGDSLGSIPLPAFLGLQLVGVEVAQQGQFLSIFTDLAPAP